MTISNREISFYVDTLIVEAVLGDEQLYKQAAAGATLMSLVDKVKGYVENQIDPNDKAGSLMNILGPGVIFNVLGFGKIGLLLSLAMRVFHVDVAGMVRSIWDKLGGLISGDRQVTSSQVNDITQSVAQEHMKPASQEEMDAAKAFLTKSDFNSLMQDVRLVKLTMIEYSSGNLKKEGGFFDSKKSKGATTSIIAKIIGWVIKVGLASAGLMVAGDVVNKFLDRPNAFDGTVQNGKPVARTNDIYKAPVTSTTTQTKFKVKPSYSPENLNVASPWTVGVTNTVNNISAMLMQFAKDVYDGLDGKESIISNTAGFRAVADRISFFNRSSLNSPEVWIPSEFKSKKQMVDYFIDDVAEKAV